MKLGQNVVIDDDCWFGDGVSIWNGSVIRSGVSIGAGSVIGHLVVVERDTEIGQKTTIQSQCHITAGAVIGDNCFFGPGVIMTNERNIANQGRVEAHIERTEIGSGVRVGAGSLILPGVRIGDNAFVAAGSLVSKDVPSGEFWAGRPARKVRDVPESEWLPATANSRCAEVNIAEDHEPCAL